MTPEVDGVSDALQGLRDAYEARGWRFHVEPSPDMVPAFLGDFRPDAIALGPAGGAVIEVRHERTPASDRQLAEVARRVSDQEGWEFRAILARPSVDAVPPIPAPTPSQLAAVLDEVETLARAGHGASAWLTAWTALEALARLAPGEGTAPRRALSAVQAVQTLAEEGYVAAEALDRFLRAARLRNAIAHGDLSARVKPDEVLAFLAELRGMTDAVAAVRQPAA